MVAFVAGALFAVAFFRPGVFAWMEWPAIIVAVLLGVLVLLALLLDGMERLYSRLPRWASSVVGGCMFLAFVTGSVWICALATP